MIRAERKNDHVEVVVVGPSHVVMRETMALIDGFLERDETREILAVAIGALLAGKHDIDEIGKPEPEARA